jgi:hypothetical protein
LPRLPRLYPHPPLHRPTLAPPRPGAALSDVGSGPPRALPHHYSHPPRRRPAATPPRLSAALSAVGLSPPWRLPHPKAALSAVGSGPPHRSPCLRRIGKGPVIALPDSCSWFVYWEGSCDRTSMLPFETILSEKITSLMFSVHCFSCSVRLIKAIQWPTTMGSDLGLTGLDLGSVIFLFFRNLDMFLGWHSVMFIGWPRNISSYVAQCHMAEEHNLRSLAPTSV